MSYGAMAREAGDPFLGGLIKSGLGLLGGGVKKILGLDRPSRPTVPIMPGGTLPPGFGGTIKKKPGIRGAVERTLPGGKTGYVIEGKRRKRINPANPKALRRAIRRQDGFVKLARRALKGSGYTIVSKGSRRPRRDLGAGHTHVR